MVKEQTRSWYKYRPDHGTRTDVQEQTRVTRPWYKTRLDQIMVQEQARPWHKNKLDHSTRTDQTMVQKQTRPWYKIRQYHCTRSDQTMIYEWTRHGTPADHTMVQQQVRPWHKTDQTMVQEQTRPWYNNRSDHGTRVDQTMVQEQTRSWCQNRQDQDIQTDQTMVQDQIRPCHKIRQDHGTRMNLITGVSYWPSQGSVIGPKEFVAYTQDIVETIDRFAIIIALCVEQLRDYCSSRRLQLNPDKTELIWFGFRANLAKLRQLDTNLSLCSVVVEPVDSVRDLGVILDSELSMAQHIGKISSTCFFHLHRLRKLRLVLDYSSMQRLLSAFIMSRLDYCNAVLVGLQACTLAPLQRSLNAAARLMVGTVAGDHVGNIMRSLHWLPIAYCIRFKLCLLMHAVNNGTGPAYITDITTPISTLPGHRRRFAATNQYEIPRLSLVTEHFRSPNHGSGTVFLQISGTLRMFSSSNVP